MEERKENIKKLIKAIVSFVTEKDGYVTKTKLLKYLYLIDIEYYRFFRCTFTGFNWIYYHYGPWAKEYEEIYENMIKTGELRVTQGSRPDLETQFISTEEKVDPEGLFKGIELQIAIRRLLTRWSDEPLGRMLDYVYFYTEPMENADKGRPLDFSKISEEKEGSYSLPKSTLSRHQIDEIRKNFYKKRPSQKICPQRLSMMKFTGKE